MHICWDDTDINTDPSLLILILFTDLTLHLVQKLPTKKKLCLQFPVFIMREE